jgi:hypothetical protein
MPGPGRFASVPLGAALGLVALVVVWGLSIPLTKLALAETGPLTLTALRCATRRRCCASWSCSPGAGSRRPAR